MGDTLLGQGRAREAVAAYERSLLINSGRIGARSKLIRILSKINSERARREFKNLKEISSFYKGL